MSLKLFDIRVTNMRTRETCAFLGQGTNLAEALSDGVKNLREPYRHRQDGRPHPPLDLTVTLPTGAVAHRPLNEWEGDFPHEHEQSCVRRGICPRCAMEKSVDVRLSPACLCAACGYQAPAAPAS